MVSVCRDPEFWVFLGAWEPVVHVLEKARLWGTWCPCHDYETEFAQGRKCQWKGRRLHQAEAFVQGTCEILQDYRDHLTLEMCGGLHWVHHAILSIAGTTIAALRLKFSFLGKLPWLFVQVLDNPARILREFGKVPLEQHHRRTRYLMSRFKGAIEKMLTGEAPPEALVHEVNRMRTYKLDEAEVEGYHANMTRICSRCRSAKIPGAFAEIRHKQNLNDLLQAMKTELGQELVCHHWNTCKSILRAGTTKHGGRGKKMPWREFVDRFYMTGRFTPSVFRKSTKGETWNQHSGPSRRALKAEEKMLLSFTKSVFVVGSTYTLPAIEDGAPPNVFTVLAWDASSSKVIETYDEEDHRLHATVQVHAVWQEEENALEVFVAQEPDHLTLHEFSADSQQFRNSILRWKVVASEHDGCQRLEDPEDPTASLDAFGEDMPVLLLIEWLRDNGWESHEGKVVHTAESRMFDIRNSVGKRSYFQVLRRWDELRERIGRMTSTEPVAFYMCWLRGIEVPGGFSAAYYKQRLQGTSPEEVVAAASRDFDPDLIAPRGPAIEDGPEFVQPQRDDVVVPYENADDALSCDDVVLPASSAPSQSSTSSSSSSSDSSGSAVEEEHGESSSAVEDDLVEPEPPVVWPAYIEGQRVTHETNDIHGYDRLLVRCPCHPGCSKRRETTARLLPGTGPRECVGFLACWVLAAPHCAEHEHRSRQWRPDEDALREWLAANPEV